MHDPADENEFGASAAQQKLANYAPCSAGDSDMPA
jgi:hypothetical protein